MATKQTTNKKAQPSTPGTTVLQWLTYAFWGWTIVAVAYLVTMLTGYVLVDSWADDSTAVAYGVAAALILLPIAFITDVLYSRREPEHKKGAASIVMILHSVLFALVAVGGLATVAFSLVNLFVTSDDVAGIYVTIATAATVSILFTKLLGRTIRHQLFKRFRLYFRLLMLAVVLVTVTLAITGPVSEAVVTRDDRAVRDNLLTTSTAINEYVTTNNMLPGSIDELLASDVYAVRYASGFAESVRAQVANGTLTYTPNTLEALVEEKDGSTQTTFYYELCATYKNALRASSDSYYYTPATSTDGYSDFVQIKATAPGTFCQSLKVTNYK